MIRSILLTKKDEYKPGQIIKLLDQTPSAEKYDEYKIIKQTAWNPKTMIGEFQVKAIKQPDDPDNLKGWVR